MLPSVLGGRAIRLRTTTERSKESDMTRNHATGLRPRLDKVKVKAAKA
ncbi:MULTISPECIES: hypothetical protein [unclassified Streptomyces]